jgi:CelD/BcsL family acetyltransferase involved in cellulose biosynthesis
MKWSIHPIRDWEALAPEWDRINAANRDIPFLRAAFLGPLLREFGKGDECVAIGTAGGMAQAAGIFVAKGKGAWETFQPSQLPLGAWVARTDLTVETALQSLVGRLPGLPLVVGLTQQDPLLTPRPPETAHLRTLDYIQTAWVDVDGAFDAYWEARGKNLRQNVRKQHNKLQAEGLEASLDVLSEPGQMAEAIADYGRLESAGWKGAEGTSIHPDNAQGRFYRAMLENFARTGHARVYRYRFGDKVVAVDLCIENADTQVVLKTTYDESYKQLSPSTLLRHDAFRRIFDEGRIRRIEFYGRVMEWHTRWTDRSRTLYHANLFRWPFIPVVRDWLRGRSTQAEPEPQTNP